MHSEPILLITMLRKKVEIWILKFVHAWYLDFLGSSLFGIFRNRHREMGGGA